MGWWAPVLRRAGGLRRVAWPLCAVWALGALAQDASAPNAPASQADEAQAAPRVYDARVVRVVDGDTVWVQPVSGGRYRKLRLDGVDAPEICQAGGTDSRDALAQRVLQQRVTVTERQRDAHGRGLADLQHQDQNVAGWLVTEGHAWSSRWRDNPGPYHAQEALARAQRRGVFAHNNPELPRAFRQRHGPCERY